MNFFSLYAGGAIIHRQDKIYIASELLIRLFTSSLNSRCILDTVLRDAGDRGDTYILPRARNRPEIAKGSDRRVESGWSHLVIGLKVFC